MASINKAIIAGNLTADPELRQTQNKTSVCRFSIGVGRKFAKEGEKHTDFLTAVAWRRSAEYICKYAHKGDLLLVEGEIQTRDFATKDGKKQTVTEIVVDDVSILRSKEARQAEEKPQFEELPDDGDLPFGNT